MKWLVVNTAAAVRGVVAVVVAAAAAVLLVVVAVAGHRASRQRCTICGGPLSLKQSMQPLAGNQPSSPATHCRRGKAS